VLEARQPLEALVIPKRQGLTRHQGLLAPLLHLAEMTFPQQLKTSIFRLLGYVFELSSNSYALTALELYASQVIDFQ